MTRTAVTTDRIARPIGPFSPAVEHRDAAFYTSGHVAQDPSTGQLIAGDVAEQTEQVLRNLEAVLTAGGRSFADVIKVSVFLTNAAAIPQLNEVYRKHFDAPYPARTTVIVAGLPLGAAVEIDLIAR